MKRSAFLWLTGAASLALSAIHRAHPDVALGVRPARTQRGRITHQAGRCFASRRLSRWSGYTLDELLA